MFGRRIAQKIWLGYAIPLAVLVVAGVVVPAVLAAILGRITQEYARTSAFLGQVQQMKRAAEETETRLSDYIRYGDDRFLKRFRESRRNYNSLHREAAPVAARHGVLRQLFSQSDASYRAWLRDFAGPQIEGKRLAAGKSEETFGRARAGFELLEQAATRRRDLQSRRAQAAARVRRAMTIVGPAAALLLALLIGRSISLGVTRPLEALTRGTEALERGQTAAMVLDGRVSPASEPDPDDEIGDLQRAFARMARTIGQREAVLRAQNEALGALNRRVEAVLNTTNDGIVMLDRGGGFSLVNQRFADLFGLESDVLLDQTFEQAGPLLLARFKDARAVRARMRELLPDPEATADETYEIVEPEHRVLRLYSAPVRGEAGDLLGRIFVFRDVTRETAVDRMKTEFISVVSHELRTPLTAIQGYVDLMLGGQTGEINELQREFLTIVQGNTGRLTALITDMLDISRIESSRVGVRSDRVDYGKIVRETARTLAHEARAKNIALAAEVPPGLPPVTGDADRIAQVLMNLLSNAIKYTPRGGRVTVTVEPADTIVTTCVADTGIGISAQDQQRLFQKFFRADNSTTREAGGTGLGLAITKAILERLHGSIWAESEPGKGSRFFFTLPAAGPPDGAGKVPGDDENLVPSPAPASAAA